MEKKIFTTEPTESTEKDFGGKIFTAEHAESAENKKNERKTHPRKPSVAGKVFVGENMEKKVFTAENAENKLDQRKPRRNEGH